MNESTVKPENVKLSFDNGYTTWEDQPTSILINDTFLQFEHQFNRSGFYDVHLYINEELIATYTIKVKNN